MSTPTTTPATPATTRPGRIASRRRGRVRALGTALLLVGAGWAVVPPAGSASGAAAASPSETTAGVVLRFGYDGRATLRGGAKVKNTAGKGKGVVRVADGGRLKKVRGRPGKAARFPRSGFALIEAPDRKAWDPRRRDFSYGSKVKIRRNAVGRHTNVVQKGYYRQPGGQWKLQIDRGRPSCVVNGDEGRLLVRAGSSVANGRWHRLVCARTGDQLTLRIDGEVVASATGDTGKVSNGSVVRVGAKKLGPGRVDQFRGRLDMTFLSIG